MQITIGKKHYHLGSDIIPDREGRGINFGSESFEGKGEPWKIKNI